MHYTAQDIWDIFIANYRLNSTFGFAEPYADLNQQTPLSDWISDCDLQTPKKLAKYYYKDFRLSVPYQHFETFFCQKGQTLWQLCKYLACYAKRPVVIPLALGGSPSQAAAIFMTLKRQLANVGENTDNLRPSTQLATYKNLGHLVNEVNKIAPNSLTEFVYEKNRWSHYANTLILLGFAGIILTVVMVPLFNFSPLWCFISLMLFVIGFILDKIGENRPPKTLIIGHCKDFRELTYQMQQYLNSNVGVK